MPGDTQKGDRELILVLAPVGVSMFLGFLAVIYGPGWLAWPVCIAAWVVFFRYVKPGPKLFRIISGITALLLTVVTILVTRSRPGRVLTDGSARSEKSASVGTPPPVAPIEPPVVAQPSAPQASKPTAAKPKAAIQTAGKPKQVELPPKPPVQQTIQVASAYGNLRDRTIDLANEVARLIKHRKERKVQFDTNSIYSVNGQATPAGTIAWYESGDAEFRQRDLQTLIGLRDEYAELHIRIQELDELLESATQQFPGGPRRLISMGEMENTENWLRDLADKLSH